MANNLNVLLELSKKLFNNTLNNVNQLINRGIGSLKKALESLGSLTIRVFTHFGKKITEITSKLITLGNKFGGISQSFNSFSRTANFNSLKVSLTQVNVVIMNAQKSVANLGNNLRNTLTQASTAGNSTGGSLSKLKDGLNTVSEIGKKLDFVNDINKTKVALEQMGVVDVDKTAASVNRLSKRMEEDPNKIAHVANTITKQMGGSMDENIALLEQAVSRGANLNSDMLAKLQEAPASLNEMGMPVKDYLAIMAQVGKDGILPETIFSSLEKGGLKFQEFGKIQKGVLSKIGMNQKDLEGKSTWGNLQTVLNAMEKAGLSIDEKQKGLNNLFKGAGEDGGKTLLDGLANGVPNFDAIKEVDAPGTALKDITSGVESAVADITGPFVPYMKAIEPLAGMIETITSLIPLWTLAQGYLNIALFANPVGLIVLAVGVLIGLIAVAIYKWDEWGAALLQFMGPIGWIINAFMSIKNNWESIIEAFKTDGIIGGLKRIRLVLFDALIKPLQQILEMINEYDPTDISTKMLNSVKDFRKNNGLITNEELKVKTEDKKPKTGVAPEGAVFTTSTTPTSFYGVNDNKKGKGLGISGGLGNNKTTGDINKVTGQANQVKKIDIRIDAFNKGGINVTNAGGAGMSVDEVERWMKEMLNRIIIDADNAVT